jgi:alpha-N-arabinofuranosidase
MRAYLACALIFIAALSTGVYASEVAPERTVLSVDLAHPGAAISPQMFGIFFEDINFAADGGLYPELVKNRSFEFSEPLTGWHEMLAFDQKGLHRAAIEPEQSALS